MICRVLCQWHKGVLDTFFFRNSYSFADRNSFFNVLSFLAFFICSVLLGQVWGDNFGNHLFDSTFVDGIRVLDALFLQEFYLV